MNKYSILKLILLFFLLILNPIITYADTEYNNLSNIVIEPLNNRSYTLNLFFDTDYKGSAFLNQTKQGSYTIFIPDTTLNNKLKNPIYKNKNDKKKIKVDIEEKPYIKNQKEEKYIKLTLNMNSDYSLKLVKKTIDEDDSYNSFFDNLNNNVNYSYILMALIIGIICLLAYKFITYFRNIFSNQSNIYVPENFTIKEKPSTSNIKNLLNKVKNFKIPKLNFNQFHTQPNNEETFPSFEIQNNKQEITPNIIQNQIISKPKKINSHPASSVQTNPIKTSKYDESTELDLPYAEKEEIQEEEKKQTTNTPNIISILKITPQKGFFISTTEEEITLFGYVNETTFPLKSFKDLSSINLQARLYDKYDDKEVYIVRLDAYKAMVEINNSEIRELAVL